VCVQALKTGSLQIGKSRLILGHRETTRQPESRGSRGPQIGRSGRHKNRCINNLRRSEAALPIPEATRRGRPRDGTETLRKSLNHSHFFSFSIASNHGPPSSQRGIARSRLAVPALEMRRSPRVAHRSASLGGTEVQRMKDQPPRIRNASATRVRLLQSLVG
jgi:hypothetical protein